MDDSTTPARVETSVDIRRGLIRLLGHDDLGLDASPARWRRASTSGGFFTTVVP